MPKSLKGRIPRPPNAFILFRAHLAKMKREAAAKQKESLQATRKKTTAEVREAFAKSSKDIGLQFKELSPEERADWDAKAEEAKAEHEKLYPDYVFKPVRRSDKQSRPEEKERIDTDRTAKNTHTVGQQSNVKQGSGSKAKRTSSTAPYTVPSRQTRLEKSASPSFPSSPSDNSSTASSSFPPTPATSHSIPLLPHPLVFNGFVNPHHQQRTSPPTLPVPQPDFSALAFGPPVTTLSSTTLFPPCEPFAETPKNDHDSPDLRLNLSGNVDVDIGTFGPLSLDPSYMPSGNFEWEAESSHSKPINTTTAPELTLEELLNPSVFEPDYPSGLSWYDGLRF